MKTVAIIAARNESAYLERCCEHLHQQGVDFCFIDNDSTNDSVRLVK